MNTKKNLFIGGIKDGEMIDIKEECFIEFPKLLPASQKLYCSWEKERYRRGSILAPTNDVEIDFTGMEIKKRKLFYFYILDSLSLADAMEMLINNYKP